MVIRDHIPAGSKLTQGERDKRKKHSVKSVPVGAITVKDHQPKTIKKRNPKTALERIAAVANSASRRRSNFDTDYATKVLASKNVRQTVQFLELLPVWKQKKYLAVEMQTENRKGVLREFPKLVAELESDKPEDSKDESEQSEATAEDAKESN